jgi:hypothetical protein
MPGTKKIIPVLFVATLLILGGCSVFRKGGRTGISAVGSTKSTILYRDILENNITPDGFYIRRARVEANIGGVRERFTANIRVTPQGQLLASIRSFAGLEVGRIYANSEEVIVLDRLGRMANIYKWNQLRDDFGIVYELLPVIFGDVPVVRNGERRRIDCGMMSGMETEWANMSILADCINVKASVMALMHRLSGREVVVMSSEYKYSGGALYPALVEVSEKGGSFHVKLAIETIEIPWKGDIEFEIPAGYRISR